MPPPTSPFPNASSRSPPTPASCSIGTPPPLSCATIPGTANRSARLNWVSLARVPGTVAGSPPVLLPAGFASMISLPPRRSWTSPTNPPPSSVSPPTAPASSPARPSSSTRTTSPRAAKFPPFAPTPAAAGSDSANLHAEDIPSLLSHLGDQVTLQGRVQNVSLVVAHNAANIELAGAGPDPVLIWVPVATYPKIISAFGEDIAKALTDHPIRVTGRLGKYGGRPPDWKERLQITLDDAAKLKLVASSDESK